MRTKLFSALAGLLWYFCTQAQSVTNYASARNTAITYASISATGNSFASWRSTTGNFTQDDNRSAYTDIGFDYWHNGVRYTQFCVSTNGFMDFATNTADGTGAAAFGYQNTSFSQTNATNATRPAIAPFYDDMTAQGGTAALGNSIKYLLSGTAPNRTLTVEWINMAVYNNTTPNLNFQVMLVESTGKIYVNYGTMTAGTNGFSYSMGLNGASSGQLKMLQTQNGTVFSTTAQNALSTVPTSSTQYVFTPPVPGSITGAMSFSAVAQTSMVLHWTNGVSNAVGYVIYNSTDGTNYDFVTQTASNVAQYSATGLLPSTTYFWKLYAVSEGCLSSALTGTQATTAAGAKTSTVSGSWGSASTWSPSGVPTSADNVTIANGHTVTMSANAVCNSLNVGQGTSGLLTFLGNTARTLAVNNNITINTGATFQASTTSNATHIITVDGNIVNNGTINFAADANSLINVTFDKDGNQSVSGTGATTTFNAITMTMGSSADNVLTISTPAVSAASGFLTLTSGTLKISTTNASTLTPFTAATTMAANNGLYLNSANLTVNINAAVTLYGSITVASGTLNIGDANNEGITSNGGTILVSGGACNIAGALDGSGVNNLCTFSISGGTLTVATYNSTSTSIAPFHISGAGSECNMTGGTIVIAREGGTGVQDLGFTNTSTSGAIVTGGTLQIGNASTPASQVMSINTDSQIQNLLVNSANATASISTNSLDVKNNVNITAGTLNCGTQAISVGGSWSNSGTFTPGTGTVNFDGTSAQFIFKSGGETFNTLSFTGSGVTTFSSPVTTSSNFSIASTASVDVSSSSHSLTVKGHFSNSGAFSAQSGLVTFSGTSTQSITGSSTTSFYNLTLNNTSGAILGHAQSLQNKLTLSNGTFSTNSNVFTMISTSGNTARIGSISATANFSGSVTVQRFAPGGYTGWALLGSPLSSTPTITDWDDNIFVSCASCPDGSAAGFISIYTYDETVAGAYDGASSYIAISSVSDAITPGKGYWVYLGDGATTTNDLTLDLTGAPGKFNVTLPLKYTNHSTPTDDGWNLICNPYPSPISWASLRAGNVNVDNAIYVYNTDISSGQGDFASYVNGVSSPLVGSGGQGDVIAMGQGFYVHATAAATLTAQESYKVDANPTFLRTGSVASNQVLMRLKLKNGANDMDETVLYFEPNAHDYFDAAYDAYKVRSLTPGAELIALENGIHDFQINGIAPVSGSFTMAVKAVAGTSGNYTITADNVSSFPAGACIHLYDKYTSVTTDLRTSGYACTLSDTTTAARFVLSITINALAVNAALHQPDCSAVGQGSVVASANNGGPWDYYWSQNGVPVRTRLNKAGADTLNNLSGGIFHLSMNTAGACDHFEDAFTIVPQVQPLAGFASSDTLDLDLFPSIQFSNTSVANISSYWDFGTGQDFSTDTSPEFAYSSPGIYTVSLIVTSATGCTDTVSRQLVVISSSAGLNSLNGAGSCILKTLDNNHYLVQVVFSEETACDLTLCDVSGKVLREFGTITGTHIELGIALEGFDHGVYFLSVTSGASKKVLKLVK